MSDQQPAPLDGLLCPRCGCAWSRVVRTTRLPSGQVRRQRLCMHCARRFSTMETGPPAEDTSKKAHM